MRLMLALAALCLERALREHQRAGAYERITSALAFADSLTAQLQAAGRYDGWWRASRRDAAGDRASGPLRTW